MLRAAHDRRRTAERRAEILAFTAVSGYTFDRALLAPVVDRKLIALVRIVQILKKRGGMILLPGEQVRCACRLLHQRQTALGDQIIADQQPRVAGGVWREGDAADDGGAGDAEGDAHIDQRISSG